MNFTELYKTYPDIELARILYRKFEYQDAAVEAAGNEIRSRNISDEQLEALKFEIYKSELEKKQYQKPGLDEKLLNFAREKASDLNPVYKQGSEKQITLIFLSGIILLGLSIILNLENFLWLFKYFDFRARDLLILLPFFVLPFGLYFFNKRDKLGWIMLDFWAWFSVLQILPLTYEALTFRPSDLMEFYQPPVPIAMLFMVLVYASYIYALNRKSILETFGVSFLLRNLTLIFTAVFTVLMFGLKVMR